MAAVSASPERTEVSQLTEPSPSRLASDVASESLSTARPSFSTDTLDRSHSSNSSPNPLKDFEVQVMELELDPQASVIPGCNLVLLCVNLEDASPASLRSEEYRQLFRLPADEVLVEDFNCALQENILIQGHMYLFVQHICFYSNIFGFETKKIIPFNEVTSVKRAKTAGIFPNAIEIVAGGKKYFFASFLSRDEAFKLITDQWLQHNNGAKGATDQQESMSESSSQGNEAVLSEKVDSSRQLAIESDYSERNKDPPELNDSQPLTVEVETVSAPAAEQQDNVPENAEPVLNAEPSSSKETCTWKQENFDAPKIPESYTKVAESKFPIKVEDFFSLFFSDDSVAFIEAFHKRCGDKGAKLGSCHEIQKFRVYENR
ncbi:putative membrane protein C20F10.07 [Morella rubra]|uniref:Putative membrane protein C20F10.07 n=1 Tax=Morella rubra TaxID=262757 RepID=A0A6A1UNV2_9ROSI|nr:putative membrane protein C20F10.07 [Morella rubra]